MSKNTVYEMDWILSWTTCDLDEAISGLKGMFVNWDFLWEEVDEEGNYYMSIRVYLDDEYQLTINYDGNLKYESYSVDRY